MISDRSLPALAVLLVLILTGLACQLPQTSTSTQTIQPITTATLGTSDVPVPTQTRVTRINPTAQATSARTRATHRIATHRIYGLAEFYDRQTSQSFVPRGVNYSIIVPVLDHYEDRLFGVGIYDHDRTESDFATLSEAGYNTVRIVLDGCTSGEGCIGLSDGQGLNPGYLDNIVDLMNLAKEENIYLLMAASDLPQLGGYAHLAEAGTNPSFAIGRNRVYFTPKGISATQTFWSDLLTGLIERQAPFDIVLGWELQSEQYYLSDQPPFSLEAGKVTPADGRTYDLSYPAQKKSMALDGLLYYIDQVRQTILDYDPTGLVSMGFLAPDAPNPWREGDMRYVVTSELIAASSLDFLDFHAYPGDGLTIQQLAQNYGMYGHILKPIVMGEVGAYTWKYPQISSGTIAVQDWIAASCSYRFSGWIYQGYYPSPAGMSNATWGFVDESRTIMKALAPTNQPDACATTVLPGRNLALGKQVTVSAALPDQTPQMAVDGDPNTQWSSGAYPMQWIEIDLGSAQSIGEFRLTVGQWPAGDTIHQLWVGSTQDSMTMLHEFKGREFDFDVINYVPNTPLRDIRYVRVVTTNSPSWVSWREIEVLAPFPATPTPIPQESPTPAP